LYLMIIGCGLLQNMVSHVIVQSGFCLRGSWRFAKVEHDIVITVVWCETSVVIMSVWLETVMIVQYCSREVEQMHVQILFCEVDDDIVL